MSNTKIKPTKEIGISDKSLKKNQNMLNSINEIKTKKSTEYPEIMSSTLNGYAFT